MIKILIADDQRLLRESFKNIIENKSDMKVVASATNGREAYDLCAEFCPDVVLMDISMPVCNGIEATKLIKSKYPDTKVLVLTASDDECDVTQAINNGADGYVLKSIGTEELILSIKSITLGMEIIQKDVFRPDVLHKNGKETKNTRKNTVNVNGIKVSVTGRELAVLEMIVEGKDNKEIGSALFIAEGTVKNTITEMISKLQLKDRTQLAVFAIKNSLI